MKYFRKQQGFAAFEAKTDGRRQFPSSPLALDRWSAKTHDGRVFLKSN
jgi:hypothetical protein